MQFTPNIWQRYAAALRNTVADRLIGRPMTESDRRALRRIHLFECAIREPSPTAVDAEAFFADLLHKIRCHYAGAKRLSYRIEGDGNRLIDPDLLQTLMLLLTSQPAEQYMSVAVRILPGSIVIAATGIQLACELPMLIAKMQGRMLTEHSRPNTAVTLPTKCVSQNLPTVRKAKGDLTDPLCLFHILLPQEALRHT